MSAPARGRLKVYLGYAAGVGKTYRMLQEARALKQNGVDIVVGYFEPHGRQDTIDQAAGLESVPRRAADYMGARFEEMDVDAILQRGPRAAIVDELAHCNVPGSGRVKRWQDVQVLLDGGVDVLTTMNVQHLESLNDQVFHATGIRVRETVPDWVVDEADELVFVDLTPRALRNRLERGAVYAQEKARRAMESFFNETNLTALREMALRHTAYEVEERLDSAPVNGKDSAEGSKAEAARGTEKILICLTGWPSSAILIRRGKRVADYLHAECLAVHVSPHAGAIPDAVERHLSFARNLRIQTHVLESKNVPGAIARFAQEHGITQIFMGRSEPKPWWKRFRETMVQTVVRLTPDKQVTIVAERRKA